jgi:hypothetical protein
MKFWFLLPITIIGLWYNVRAARMWWATQRTQLPPSSDIMGWLGVSTSVLWYGFLFVFFAGLTLNNTLFR